MFTARYEMGQYYQSGFVPRCLLSDAESLYQTVKLFGVWVSWRLVFYTWLTYHCVLYD
jgi:hypothetical protein